MPPVIGVDVGGTKVLAVAVDPADPTQVLASARVPTPDRGADLVDAVVRSAGEVRDALAPGTGAPGAVGIGLPGLVDAEGCLRAAPNLGPGVGVPVRAPVEAALGLPVVVGNDASCAVWAEVVAGAGRGASDVVLVTLGTGIGGGVVTGGRLHGGAHGFAGEPGHMVVDPSGPPCPCGRRGCWERFASGRGLEWLARQAIDRGDAPSLVDAGDDGEPTGERLAALARRGDPAARAVFDTHAWWLAVGIANLVNLLDPELVLVGGGLADASDLYLERARSVAAGMVMGSPARSRTRIDVASLGSTAGAIGAALLAGTGGEGRPG